jgi:CheY-like chemotaxis protein
VIQSRRESSGVILLVEDDSNQVIFLRRALDKLKVTNPVQVATTGDQAIVLLSDRSSPPPSLVLLDLRVPRVSGLRILDWMRKQPELRDTPVVIVTSSIEPEDRRLADQLGAIAYLCKPVSAEGVQELMDMVPWLQWARQGPSP